MFKQFILLLSFIVVLLNFTNCGSGGGSKEEPVDSNQAPVVNAGSDKSAKINQSITIVGSATDSDGRIVSYEWKKGNMVLATTATFSYLPTVVGTDKLTLVVIDNSGAVASDSMVVMVSENSTSTLSEGLVAHYEFEGNAKDSSGNGNDGVEHGGITYVDGVIGRAGSFDGVDDYIETNTAVLQPIAPYSISVWVKYNNVPSTNKYIVANGGETHSSEGFFLLVAGSRDRTCGNSYPNGAIEFGIGNKLDNIRECMKADMLPNYWNNITAIWNGSNLFLYSNGKLLSKSVVNMNNGAFGKQNNMRIGSPSDVINYLFNGLIDDLRIYNRALNEAEIKELYKLGEEKNAIFYKDFAITKKQYEETINLDEIVQNTFGSEYRIADWQDLEKFYYYKNGNLLDLFDNLNLKEYESSAYVTWHGKRIWSGKRHYYLSRHEHNKPINYLDHASIDNNLISLGSWYTT